MSSSGGRRKRGEEILVSGVNNVIAEEDEERVPGVSVPEYEECSEVMEGCDEGTIMIDVF